MRTKIEKKKTIVHFTLKKREKKVKKETISDDNLTIIHCHASYHLEENTIMHIKRQWKIRFDN
jgi:hypothetical protein